MSHDIISTSNGEEAKGERSSIVEKVKQIRDNYKIIIIFLLGFGFGGIIDLVFVLDVFYYHPYLSRFVIPVIGASLSTVFYIGAINKTGLIRFLESFLIGTSYYFVIRAFTLIMIFVEDYITNYSYLHTYTYIAPHWLIFSIVRSLGLSGFFALLEKGLSLGQKYYLVGQLSESQAPEGYSSL